jgi:signal transduction histidine kinase/DNA-binding response OmpR family regulator/CHASE3 domain sensor protein/HAMP domain-containing protein
MYTIRNKFKRNLLIGFGASLLILTLSSVASFISIRNLLESATLVNHTNEVIRELDEIGTAMIDAETGQRGFLLSGEEVFLQPYENSKTRVMDAFEVVRGKTKDNAEQQASLSTLRKLIDDRFGYLESSIQTKRNQAPLDMQMLARGRKIMDQVRSVIKAMEQREKELLAVRTENMNQFANLTPPLIIAAAMIALLITVSFYVRVRNDFEERANLQLALEEKDREISARIDIIKGIADQVAQGSYEVRVNDKESDSLGSVAGSLNRMAQSLDYSFGMLSDKEWTQTGLAGLNDAMLGEKPIEALASDVINFLATYTNSHASVVYELDQDDLCAIAGYAFVPQGPRKKLRRGDGLVGQAAVAGKVLELKDIQAESITISFASGEAKPRHVIAIPVFDGYVLKGVIELASLAAYAVRDIDFLKSAAPNIGIALTMAQNRKRLQDLLEETQSQSEELRSQHSELENLNSELEVQAEKLQASEEELKVQQEELKQANQELEERSRLLEERNHTITERNIDIQTKADELAQSTRYKSEFLANMSHELRTPLNSILLLSRLMSENQEKNLTEDQIEYAKVIQSSGHGLLSLIDEILDLSKIEAGKMQLEYQSVSLMAMVSNMRGLFEPVAAEKGIALNMTVAPECPERIETDQMRLEQILRNLFSNAIKFTAKGHVSLHISPYDRDPNFIQFRVRDTGIGIPLEKQRLVFEAFQQADGSTRRKYGGTGLGLSISRELAKLLGGDIMLSSQPDEGSEFTIAVPIRKEDRLNPVFSEVVVRKPQAVDTPEVRRPISKYISDVIPENIPDDRKHVERGDKVILIVEDDVNFAKSLLEYTRKRGYKGIVAVRGDEGIELARQYMPMGILLDIQLPVVSGWDVMAELKDDPHTRSIPVHIMSSYEVKNESLMKGAVDFINKPFAFEKVEDVFSKIEHVLTHHPKKVLIVEENPKHAKALAYFLETFDVSIEINNAVDAAIQSLKSESINCVILDMGIPDQKGYDTLEEVRKTPGLENIPIIIFTGKSLSQAEEMRIKQYADSIVVKTAHSYKRVLDEVSLFLHLMEKNEDETQVSKKYNKLGALDEVLKNKSVLIADDDMRNIFSLTKALEKYQMKVIAAVDGKDALQKLRANPDVDIVLMDMMMPEMDGYETTAAIRKDPKFRDLPVIAVTAKAMMGDKAKCINAGASDYITKPVDIDQMFSLLRVWLYEKGRK